MTLSSLILISFIGCTSGGKKEKKTQQISTELYHSKFSFEGGWISTTFFDSSIAQKAILKHSVGIPLYAAYITFSKKDIVTIYGLYWNASGLKCGLDNITDTSFTITDGENGTLFFAFNSHENVLKVKSSSSDKEDTFRRDDSFKKYITKENEPFNADSYLSEKILAGDYVDISNQQIVTFSIDSTNFWGNNKKKYFIACTPIWPREDVATDDEFIFRDEKDLNIFIWECKHDTLRIFRIKELSEPDIPQRANLYRVLVKQKKD
jgi:hypothetical protein